MLMTSSLLRSHVEAKKVVLGVNHAMTDYATGRKKKLDLVVARPAGPPSSKEKTFASLAHQFGIELTDEENAALAALPALYIAPVSSVLIAVEAKACMTEHTKALPRLYDELNSSHLCIHGASKQALAIGYVHVNMASDFISPGRNHHSLTAGTVEVTTHDQPRVTQRVLAKVAEIPRRSASSEVGFDGVGVTVVRLHNNGTTVDVVDDPPAPQPGDTFHYADMITRMATGYDATFAKI
ncbi:hypothetical protein [Amycolatopsis sp. lyj-84]|uniref:hypothetical protein n=1 Tax=Amycolatopsis sp. lyj-84 TaxID=2789284 RepID=UPI00397BDE01